jgi:hypothetical protein
MESNGPQAPSAAVVFRLAEAVERLCWFAECQWSLEPAGAPTPDLDVVEGHVERVVKLTDDLAREAIGGGLVTTLQDFTADLDRSWQAYREVWESEEHREALRVWENVHAQEAESPAEVREAIIRRSPAIGQIQHKMRETFLRLVASLPDDLRVTAEIGQLLARPDYPGMDFRRVVEEAGGSSMHYLRRVLRRQVEERWPTLLHHFPFLADVDPRIDGCSAFSCHDSVSRLREELGNRLSRGGPPLEERPNPESQPASERAAEQLTFEPGAFVYRGHREPLSGKPLQVIEALYLASGNVCTLKALQDTIWKDTSSGEEAIRSAVQAARDALRRAMRAVSVEGPKNPIPTADRGSGRTAWRLDLP